MSDVVDSNCGDCRFAGAHPDNDKLRLCRCQSPGETNAQGRAKWPVVDISEDWCGDFEEAIDA